MLHRLCTTLLLASACLLAAADFVQPSTVAPGTELGRFGTEGGRNARLAFHRGYLYVEPQTTGKPTTMWDLTDPAQPVFVRSLGEIPQVHRHGKVGNALIFSGLRVIDAGANPANPSLSEWYSRGESGSYYYPFRYSSTSGYNQTQASVQTIHDLRTDAKIGDIPTLADTGIRAGHPIVIGNLMLWSANQSNGGVAAYDIGDPANPRLLDVLGNLGSYGSAVHGHYLLLAHASASVDAGVERGVKIIDFSDPRNLRVAATIADATIPGDHRYIQCQDEFIFVGSAKIDLRTRAVVQSFGGVDDNDFLLPLGNMVAIGGRVSTPVRIFVHQRDPDRRGPFVNYHNPADGAVNQPRTSRIGLVVPENLESSSIVNGQTARVRPVGGTAQPVDGFWCFNTESVLTFTPAQQLAANTTYEVELTAGGIRDVAGNALEQALRFRFSTGPSVDLTPIGGTPPAPTPHAFTAGLRLPCEDFAAGAGTGYVDSTPGNAGSSPYRPGESVDLEPADDSDDDGKNVSVGFITDGEWLGYTVTATAGTYDLAVRVASNAPDAGSLRLRLGGTVLGTLDIAPTGGWFAWQTLVLPAVSVPALASGQLRLESIGGKFNLNWLEVRSRNRAPVIASVTLDPSPALVGQSATLSLAASDADGDSLQARWDFADGTPSTAWLAAGPVQHTWSSAGHRRVVVEVRDGRGGEAVRAVPITVLPRAPDAVPALASGPLVGEPGSGRCWTVDADNHVLTAMDPVAGTRLWTVAVGAAPQALALDTAPAEDALWLACRDGDRLECRSAVDGRLLRSVALEYGDAPQAVLVDGAAGIGWASLGGAGAVLRFRLGDGVITHRVTVGPQPRALALSSARDALFVTRFIASGDTGTVWELDPATLVLRRSVVLQHDPGPDGGSGSRGVPNYLSGLAISPVAAELRVAGKKDNIRRGLVRDGLDLEPDVTVRSLVAAVAIGSAMDSLARRIDLDNREQVAALAFSPDGDYLFCAMQGNDEVAVLDAFSGDIIARYATGAAPQGLWVDAGRRQLLCKDFLGRTVSVFDIGPLLGAGDPEPRPLRTVATIAGETLAAPVLVGKKIFYNASDPRMSSEGYLSCASCHLDGAHDGRTWDFTGRGEGLRNSIDLRGRRGLGHGRVHWSGNFDEIHDFEHDMRGPFGGTGFMTDADFNSGSRNTPLGDAKAGRSAALDALAAYVTSLDRVPRSPHRNADGTMTATALAGKAVFARLDCASCHGGADFTDSAGGLLHDVGTIRTTSGKRLGLTLTGIDTPTLKGLWDTAPYLHDGSAADLAAVIARGDDRHGAMAGLDATERTQLLAFLQQLDESPDAVVPATSRRRISIDLIGAGAEWAWWLQPLEGTPSAAGPAMNFLDLTRVREHRLGLQGLGDG